jgi:hypothetical protein
MRVAASFALQTFTAATVGGLGRVGIERDG